MLVTLSEILRIAEAKKCAIGSFNTPNLESIQAVIGAAEELGVPVIIMHAEIHESIMPLSTIGPIMILEASKAKVPVCVHLDHGENLAYISKALDIGFTSVMYDGSHLTYEENVANTCIAVSMAKRVGASVEAEIGVLGIRENGGYETTHNDGEEPKDVYTDPEVAYKFVKETNIDALACSFGTVHGIYLKKPKLDMELLERINKKVGIPLVMHGGSGVSQDDYRTVIKKGVRKINYYTYMAKAGGEYIKKKLKENENIAFYHDIAVWACEAMKEDVKEAMKVFSKAPQKTEQVKAQQLNIDEITSIIEKIVRKNLK
jgi:fructose-bisphosphate aldolase, class II